MSKFSNVSFFYFCIQILVEYKKWNTRWPTNRQKKRVKQNTNRKWILRCHSFAGKSLTSQIYSELGSNNGEDGVKGYTIQSERTLLRALVLTGHKALPVVMCKFQTSTEFWNNKRRNGKKRKKKKKRQDSERWAWWMIHQCHK